mmetsp:Transcript_68100/g.163439  ORF Transcript_68100/g.163439 Transcript_68100/m.163439 type:complete len:239 (+) Transcript_68100:125-841(+)|eukprot:CAMPEP_0178432150 /NCGR_PEP_ID=MMETSP0689_2-20121128/32231_1 /TAXON_ID=160604 /ORGANISM="Amphidinium massartii, Strain CS-259" /LENGTH=238 /DNA_ID=CAMNT_0020054117 /DNA_START=76 /DNA_END=792 /DNA_ORIENTATION=-
MADGYAFGARPAPSSNAFASGSNQNCGNSICDRPMTRVVAPPGGSSSISFGWEDTSGGRRQPPPNGPPERQPRDYYSGAGVRDDFVPAGVARSRDSANSFASGANQNNGNVISDTSTTRRICPPGGSSSLNLSWSDNDPAAGGSMSRPARHVDDAPAYGARRMADAPFDAPPPFAVGGGRGAAGGRPPSSEVTFGSRPRVSSNSYASGANQNVGNVISDTPTTRVSRPPGGATTLQLG